MPPAHSQIPPLSPSSHIPVTHSPRNNQQSDGSQDLTLGVGPSHSRSFSQPLFYSADSLPPLSPSSYRGRGPTSGPTFSKTHRRANSDIPFGFSTILQSSPPLIPLRSSNGSAALRNRDESNVEGFVEKKYEGEVADDLFTSYIKLKSHGILNSFRTENVGDSSDNEATSSVVGSDNSLAPTRHYRSISVDSVMAKLNFVDESFKLLPSSGGQIGKLVSTGTSDTNSDTFSIEFGNGVFNEAELKKIMASETLAEMALTDPKRVKRILANRQSAARSKERKMRYIAELENKVQTIQNEAKTLFAQVTLLQGNLTSLTSQNNELKFRLQANEEQAHLRDALNDTLTAEVQRLKILRMESNEDMSC